jgi:hypothetical protein
MTLCALFNLPFRFVDPGTYDISLDLNHDKYHAKIKLSLGQESNKTSRLSGMQIEKSESASIELKADEHGVFNFTKVLIEFDSKIGSIPEDSPSLLGNISTPIKIISLEMLNKLGYIIRGLTNNFWIRPINLRDIHNFKIIDKDTQMFMTGRDFSEGYYFPKLKTREQSSVRTAIEDILRTDSRIPQWKNLFLDAINYFTIGRYNESIIIMNTSLESYIAEFFFNKLTENGNVDNPKREILNIFGSKFHRVMERHFKDINGRSFKDNKTLWSKFDHSRCVRRCAVHSFTRQIDHDEAKKVLEDIMEIMDWVNPEMYRR